MSVIVAVFALAAAVWGSVYTRRGSLLAGCGLLVVVAYALGHEFWNAKIGPIPLTLDRLVLIGLLGAFVYQLRTRAFCIRPLTGSDWMLATMLGVLAISTILSGQPEFTDGVTSKWGRLVASFLLPAALYAIIRQLDITRREWARFLATLVALGVYLALTGAFEVAGRWSLVFPRYIADPTLGIHFGRARGPDLNSVSLGLYVTACLVCAWTLVCSAERRSYQLALLLALPLMAFAVLLTFTRSTWIGLAASGLVITAFQIPPRWRLPAIASSALIGFLIAITSWQHLIGLEREGTAEESEHSVNQRESFAYVSWQMFRDNPILGVGFGRFYDRKLPYLSDRSQNFELESLRKLHHHNTILSILTETGLIGLAAFIGVFVAWTRSAIRLALGGTSSPWVRAHGVLMLAIIVNYLCSAVFHDLTLVPSQELLLFVFAAVTVNLAQQAAPAIEWRTPRLGEGRGTANRETTPFAASGRATHVPLFGMQISNITMYQTLAKVLIWCREPRTQSCRFIVTPNSDHAVLFQQHPAMQAAYRNAALVLADGWPLVLASRLLGQPLPERVAGSDLVPKLFTANTHSGQTLRVFLLGAAPGVADLAARKITQKWPGVQVVGTYSPPLGFENDADENDRILVAVAAAAPDLMIVGLGAPKQEVWVHQNQHRLEANVVVCAGATIDFLAGHRRRSPVWMQQLGLEWFYRLCAEPRRLAGRYVRDAWVLPHLVWQQWRGACA
jgi:N-acetylglucosaminyldiphosphoundecaprenol N-acetyl-beta-D-mannosaminyltransferase